jgi:hypothetical protein
MLLTYSARKALMNLKIDFTPELTNSDHFADQSSLSRTLDELTLKNIDELRSSTAQIWKSQSQVMQRDWRKFLWLDFDLSALPCGPMAEKAMKGYFAEKKTATDAN